MNVNTLTTKQILKKIEKGNYKYVKIFEGFVANTDDEKIHFECFDCKSKEELMLEIQEFADEYKGRYTITMRRHNGGSDRTLCRQRWSTMDEVEATTTTAIAHTDSGLSREQIRKEVLEEVRKDLEISELKAKLALEQQEKSKMNDNGEKLAFVAVRVLELIGAKKFSTPVMQGIGNASTEDVNDPEALEAALLHLTNLLGEDTIIKLAAKMQPGSDLINTVKMFANS